VQGKEDTSVYPDNAGMLFEARKGNTAPTDIALFPGLRHFYKSVPAELDPMAAFGPSLSGHHRPGDPVENLNVLAGEREP